MKFHFIILFSLLIFSGCVKNTISIHVNPKGDFEMTIHTHGDEKDISLSFSDINPISRREIIRTSLFCNKIKFYTINNDILY